MTVPRNDLITPFITREQAQGARAPNGNVLVPSDVVPPSGRNAGAIAPPYAAWLICNLSALESSGWPQMGPERECADNEDSSPQLKMGLAFAAEINARLRKCGRDGRVCLAYYRDNRTLDDIRAHWYEFGNDRQDRKASVRSIHYMIKNSLLYCSGKDKTMPYSAWLKQRLNRCRNRNMSHVVE